MIVRVVPLAVGVAAASAGCAGPGARTVLPQRPIDEGRAGVIITKCLDREGLKPAEGTVVQFDGKPIKVDVMAAGRSFGVAYLSPNDLIALSDHPLGKKKKLPGDPLRIESGAIEGGGGAIRFVVLYSTDYQYDDTEGSGHEATVMTAENKLDRDVRDFVMITRREKFE